ncbi:MAG TPA: YciI family protein [Azospirillaceae bacterium]|nr:YciI family protein [Azospirillaceae bacterium]
MLFSFYCADKPGHAEVRTANRAAHLAFLERHAERLFAAGPLLSDDGQSMVGSILIVECDDRAAADAFAVEDPYAQAGLFESVTIRPWRRVYPKD